MGGAMLGRVVADVDGPAAGRTQACRGGRMDAGLHVAMSIKGTMPGEWRRPSQEEMAPLKPLT